VIFVDTGPFLARYLAADQFHDEAVVAFKKIDLAMMQLATSNFVLDELLTLLGRCADYKFAAEKARSIYSSRRIRILRSTHETELMAVELFEKYADQKVSVTDCVSFALMREHRIKRTFTFDQHFSHAGFELFTSSR
jgi:predicted nucleic acid-binding protein